MIDNIIREFIFKEIPLYRRKDEVVLSMFTVRNIIRKAMAMQCEEDVKWIKGYKKVLLTKELFHAYGFDPDTFVLTHTDELSDALMNKAKQLRSQVKK